MIIQAEQESKNRNVCNFAVFSYTNDFSNNLNIILNTFFAWTWW